MNRKSQLLAVLAGALAILGCGSNSSNGATNSAPFVIGAIASWSGTFGANGPSEQPAFEYARDHINATGGILGRKVRFIFRDDASDTNKAVLAAKDLMDTQKVDAIFPEAVTDFVTAQAPFVTQHKLISFTSATAFNDPQKAPYTFAIGVIKPQDVAADVAALAVLPQVVSGQPQIKKVGILAPTYASGKIYAQTAEKLLPAAGYTVTGDVSFTSGATDLTVQLQQLKQGNPDALLVHAYGPDTGTFGKALRDVNWKNVIVMGDQGAFPYLDLQSVLPKEVQNQIYFPLYKGASRQGDNATGPWIDALAQHGPITHSLVSQGLVSDALLYMRWAFNKADSTDPDKVKAILEGVGKLSQKDLPQDLVFFTANPNYTATDHSADHADISNLYVLGKVSAFTNGTFERIADLKVVSPT
jgi:ABC-type branched-subunit amino acid transport system substrate-binding protein